MTKWVGLKRKSTGGLRKRNRKRKKYERGSDYIPSVVGPEKKKKVRCRGGKIKVRLFSSEYANVIFNGKATKTKIISVIENPSDPHFVRQNIMTKGAIIKTELGKAVVTSRPGQDGIINAKLIEKGSS